MICKNKLTDTNIIFNDRFDTIVKLAEFDVKLDELYDGSDIKLQLSPQIKLIEYAIVLIIFC